jgi:O-antigen ligase
MPHNWRLTQVVDTVCAVALFGWLLTLPLPFGSNVESARPLITSAPVAICLVAAVSRLIATRGRSPVRPTPAYLVLSAGSLLWLGLILLQLLPLPRWLLGLLSPASLEIWEGAGRALASAGVPMRHWFPLTVDLAATARELARLFGIFAAFQAAALLIRTHGRRMSLVSVLVASALFQVIYGINEAALNRFAIWGWKNTKIYGRITGTFVNPNHFAHYLAIVIPLLVFIVAMLWRHAAPVGVNGRARLAALIERHFLLVGFVILSAAACVAAILLAQSRGALLAMLGGCSIVAALATRRSTASRLRGFAAAAAIAAMLLIAITLLVALMGADRTVARFIPTAADATTLVGRRVGFLAAADVWRAFPLAGSGAGSFVRVVSLVQREPLGGIIYHHAHNDYMEVAATTGTAGAAITFVTLLAGYVLLFRMSASGAVRWRRRAFELAALGSLSIAMVHALLDFNFFIPSNPLTLAVVLGAAVAPLLHDMRTPL